MEIRFTVHGLPAPQGSFRAVVSRNNPKVAILKQSNERTMPWRQEVSAVAGKAAEDVRIRYGPVWPTNEAVECRITFRMPRPQSHYKKNGEVRPSAPLFPGTKPDLDKLVRAILDALTGVIYTDDSRVVRHRTEKVYADRNAGPGAVIELVTLGKGMA